MVQIQQVSKSYAKHATPAVDNLTLTLQPGEIFGFIGANGAGKTTTIKMMTGILEPDSGSISIFGHDIASDPIGAKRCVGYVPDNHELYDRLKGSEYLDFMGDVYQVPLARRKERTEALLDAFELRQALHDQISSYSHGMKQKLCVIGALLSQPPLWILDEPLTGLDPQSAFHLKRAMRSHCDQGNIVFFSTHVLEVAQQLCDRVGIIQAGKLIAIGTLEELTARYGADGQSLESLYLSMVGESEAAQ